MGWLFRGKILRFSQICAKTFLACQKEVKIFHKIANLDKDIFLDVIKDSNSRSNGLLRHEGKVV